MAVRQWSARQVKVRGGLVWELLNAQRDRVAIFYTTESDARLGAAAPTLRRCLRRATTMLGQFEPQLSPSRRKSLEAMRALVGAHS